MNTAFSIVQFDEEVDKLSQQFKELYNSLSPQDLNCKLATDVWSPGQILEHIILINGSYFPVIFSAKNGTIKLPWLCTTPWVYKRFSKMILKSVDPSTLRKTKTFNIWKPSQTEVSETILDDYLQHHIELKMLANESRELLNQNQLIHSPANKWIVYPLEVAFRMIILHEQRHFLQAKRSISNIKLVQ